MAFKPFKLLGKLVGSLIPGVGVVQSIIAPGKTTAEKKEGLELLAPIAQYNLTSARPLIAKAIVFTYLGGVVIQWIQTIFKVQQAYRVVIPDQLSEFAVIVVGVIVGSRGIEKIVGKIFSRKDKKKK
ncbi:MAG: hypothetical protein V3V81_08030 [Candidatus Bathyarchaeia archaeon]